MSRTLPIREGPPSFSLANPNSAMGRTGPVPPQPGPSGSAGTGSARYRSRWRQSTTGRRHRSIANWPTARRHRSPKRTPAGEQRHDQPITRSQRRNLARHVPADAPDFQVRADRGVLCSTEADLLRPLRQPRVRTSGHHDPDPHVRQDWERGPHRGRAVLGQLIDRVDDDPDGAAFVKGERADHLAMQRIQAVPLLLTRRPLEGTGKLGEPADRAPKLAG